MKKQYVTLVSGGKDSTATLIHALETYGKDNVIACYNDTGWDHPLTYEYLLYLEQVSGVRLHRTIGWRGKSEYVPDLPALILKMGQFPGGGRNFCTTYLKQYAMSNYFRDVLYRKDTQFVFLYGIRTEESANRKRKYGALNEKELHPINTIYPSRYGKRISQNLYVNFPILNRTTATVFDTIKQAGWDYNPLYDEGTNDRVGCYPCMLASQPIQEAIFSTKEGGKRWQVIKKLEKAIGEPYRMQPTDAQCAFCKA